MKTAPQLPTPHPDNAGRSLVERIASSSFARIAKLWTPTGANETASASVSRYALQLIDRITGKAYSADELGVNNANVVGAIEEDPAAVRVASGSRPRYAHNIDTAMAAMRMYIESNRSTGFKVAGDSLGNAPEEYVGGLASHIAARYPNLRVITRLIQENANASIREWSETVVQAGSGERYWLTPATSSGNFAMLYSYADCPSPTGDFDIEIKIRVNNWEENNGCDLVGWWGGTSPLNRVAKVIFIDGRRLRLQWYNAAGALQSNLTGNLGTVSGAVVATAPADGTDWWLRVRCDVDNGSGGTAVTFSKSTDGITWTDMTTVTTASTTGLYDNTAAGYTACTLSGSTTTAMKSTRFYALRVRHGHGTKTVNLLPIDRASQGSSTNLSTLNGSPTLVIENYSYPGHTTSSLVTDANAHWDRLMGNNGDCLVMCHAGMNDTWAGDYTVGSYWTDGIQILIDKMLSRAPLAHPVLIATNPRVSTTAGVGGATQTNIQSQTFIDHHGLRHGRMGLYAQQKRYGFVNWHRAIKDDGRLLTTLIPDGVHPTATAYAEIINPILNEAFDAP